MRLIIGAPGKIVTVLPGTPIINLIYVTFYITNEQESSRSNAALFLFLLFSETFNAMLYRCSVLTSSEYPKCPGDFHMKEMGCSIKPLKETDLGMAQVERFCPN